VCSTDPATSSHPRIPTSDTDTQALEYERAQPELDLSDFYQSVTGKMTHPTVVAWADEVLRRRDALLASRAAVPAAALPDARPVKFELPDQAAGGRRRSIVAAMTVAALGAMWLLR
jgi:hypothetical protein